MQLIETKTAVAALLRVDAELTILDASPYASVLAGDASCSLVGRPLASLFSSTSHAALHDLVDAARRGSDAHVAELEGVERVERVERVEPVEGDEQPGDADEPRRFEATIRSISDASVGVELHVSVVDITERWAAQRRLAEQEEFLRSVLSGLREGIMVSDLHGNVVACNEAARSGLGLHHEHPHMSDIRDGHAVIDANLALVPPDRSPSTLALSTQRPVPETVIGRRNNVTGEIRWFLTNSRPLYRDNRPLALAMFIDITARKRLDDELAEGRHLLAAVLDHLDVGIVAVDHTGREVLANPTAKRLLRRPEEHVTDPARVRAFEVLDANGASVAPTTYPTARALLGETVNREQFVLRWTGEHDETNLSVSATPMRREDGTITGAVTVSTDVTALKQAERKLARLALHDELTGLANRRQLDLALDAAVARNLRTPGAVAVLFCDLDGFKDINDTYGHETGDALLMAVAERLRSDTRPGDIIARLGGDEFVIIIEPVTSPADVDELATRIRHDLQRPFPLGHATVTISGSVGIATTAEHTDADTLLAAADRAMYRTKPHRTRVR